MKVASRIGFLVVLATSVAGCTFPLANGPEQLPQVNNRFPIKVEPQVAAMSVPVAADGGLQARDADRVRAFANIWKDRGYGSLALSSNGSGASASTLREVRSILLATHVADTAIRVSEDRGVGGSKGDMVQLSFLTDTAIATPCEGLWEENMGEEPRNLAPRDFACASQQNLAALVEDPRDLVQPRQQDPADAMRRGTVLDKYRKGESSATQTDKSEDGLVSNVAKE
jgi:pilus assembly protein CpaD